MSPRKKVAISSFVKSGNLILGWIRTWDLARHSQTPYPLYQIFLWKIFDKISNQILRDILNLSLAESPVESNNNRRFLLKRQKTRNAHIF